MSPKESSDTSRRPISHLSSYLGLRLWIIGNPVFQLFQMNAYTALPAARWLIAFSIAQSLLDLVLYQLLLKYVDCRQHPQKMALLCWMAENYCQSHQPERRWRMVPYLWKTWRQKIITSTVTLTLEYMKYVINNILKNNLLWLVVINFVICSVVIIIIFII